jgi:ubiquinone/menaquinone biosynthesis C-methylase UbiE
MTRLNAERPPTPAKYDTSIGRWYDLVGGRDVYHRIFWGVSTREYREFAGRASRACPGGWLLDAGCGSMLFSAGAHLRNDCDVVVGTDISRGMLHRACRRLGSERRSRHVWLTRADILTSPFLTAAFDVLLCMQSRRFGAR